MSEETDDRVWAGWTHLAEPREDLESSELELSHVARATLDKSTRAVLAKVSKHKPALLRPEVGEMVTLDKAEVKALLDDISNVVEKSGRFLTLRRFLEVLDAGNRSGRFRAAIPYLPAPLPQPDRSPFAHISLEKAKALDALKNAYIRSINTGVDDLTPEQWWGRTCLSAMLYGGLFRSSKLLEVLPQALESADHELRWITFSAESTKGARFRWFPDPLTRLLLVSQSKHGIPPFPDAGGNRTDGIMRVIRAYANQAGLGSGLLSNFSKLREAIKTRLYLTLPPFLVQYLAGKCVSTSLPEPVWQRVLNPPDEIPLSLPRIVKRSAHRTRWSDSEEAPAEEEWPRPLRLLAIEVRKKDSKAVGRWLETQTDDLLPSVRLLAEWVDRRLKRGRHARRALADRTIYGMFNSIGARLAGQLARKDISQEQDPDFFIELYQVALEDTPSLKTRQRVAKALRSFHDFLVKQYQVPEVSDSGIFGVYGKAQNNVDANLLGIDSFLLALKWLQSEEAGLANREVVDALCCIASLGFFAGLRRSEAVGLAVDDLEVCMGPDEEIKHVDLLVRPNGIRRLKTRSSRRILPLSEFMTDVELKRLVRWHARRQEEAKKQPNQENRLFHVASLNRSIRHNDPLMEKITQAIQLAANDPTLRFHHLRHSFASWQIYKFWRSERAQAGEAGWPSWFRNTAHEGRRDVAARKERTAVLGASPTSRRTLLQVSQLLGHSGADITLFSYVHLLDIMAASDLRRLAPKLTPGTLQRLSGFSPAHGRRLRTEAANRSTAEIMRQAEELEYIANKMILEGKHTGKNAQKKPPIDFQSPMARRVPHSPEERQKVIIEILKTVSSIAEYDAEAVAHKFGIAIAESNKLQRAFQRIPRRAILKRKTAGQQGTGSEDALTVDELGPKEQELFARTWDVLERLHAGDDGSGQSEQAVSKRLREAMQVLSDCWMVDTPLTIHAADLPAAKKWLWLMDQMRLSDGVVVLHCPSESATARPVRDQRRYWKGKLNLSIDDTWRGNPCGKTVSENARGSVIIKIDPRNVANEILPVNKSSVLYGVRLAMVIWGLYRATFREKGKKT